MCCIFTCCGWMIDLVQRLWTFTMSCCVSSAVCCAFATASMSGIALGYNYSLAEYIDLKETNVSVYIKRGVFDDEIADDMDWRRSGHKPISGHIGENNLMTGQPADGDSTPLRSGRRLDNSIFESDDQNKFEGSLMKLTAKALYSSTIPTKGATSDLEMSEIIAKYPDGSLDQLKAVQSLINMRKSADARDSTVKDMPKSTYAYDERYLPHAPHFPDVMATGRRRMHVQPGQTPYDFSLRQAVPGAEIAAASKWMLPKVDPKDLDKVMYEDLDRVPTYPSPIEPRRTPVRPTKPKAPVIRVRPTPTTKPTAPPLKRLEENIPKSVDRRLEEFKEKLLLEKYDAPGIKDDEFLRMPKRPDKSQGDYYDEDIKGLPVRKRRHINKLEINKSITNNIKLPSRNDRNTQPSISVLSEVKNHDKESIGIKNHKEIFLVNKVLVVSNQEDNKLMDMNILFMKGAPQLRKDGLNHNTACISDGMDNTSKDSSSTKTLILKLLRTTTA